MSGDTSSERFTADSGLRAGPAEHAGAQFYLVGAGIASLAAAAFLIRDGGVKGQQITVFEESEQLGGALDAAGSPQEGYVARGGRMFERHYVCTFDLFASIPTLDDSKTVTQEILDWNETMKTSSNARLIRRAERETAPLFGLSERHILTIERLAVEPESMLGRSRIDEQFDASFFKTNFWIMWSTTFAFQPWHSAVEFKRYLVRFVHMVAGFNQLHGILRTVYNQYDSMVRPLLKWLSRRGVSFVRGTRVVDLDINDAANELHVERIHYLRDGVAGEISVRPEDRVLVTLGSMTEASSLGAMDLAPPILGKNDGGAWALWEKLAAGRSHFGHPATFADHVDQSRWVSFTTTLYAPDFLRSLIELTGNVPGEGGLITFPDSAWMLSIVVPHQPHFIGQPEDVAVFWGYGLTVGMPGNFVSQPMAACSGREIMTELLGHLRMEADAEKILESALCVPCMMPFITSQFLPRESGDRPDIVPAGARNFAFIGQFCEQPDDVVFTVEYSIRSAQTAVYRLLALEQDPPPVYQGKFDPKVLYNAYRALHDHAA